MVKALALISAGIDSPVAAWLMKQKGLDVLAVHFDNRPYSSDKVSVTRRLCQKTGITKLFVIKHGKNQLAIIRTCNRKYQCVICRRMMLRIAEQLAKKERCKFLITGENLSQVASQTLSNLATEKSAAVIPVLRPLLCHDKEDIIAVAKSIGTYSLSIEKGNCCKAVPKNPATRSLLSDVEHEEKKLGINVIVKDAVKNAEVVAL